VSRSVLDCKLCYTDVCSHKFRHPSPHSPALAPPFTAITRSDRSQRFRRHQIDLSVSLFRFIDRGKKRNREEKKNMSGVLAVIIDHNNVNVKVLVPYLFAGDLFGRSGAMLGDM
jgi:hypothetical protein